MKKIVDRLTYTNQKKLSKKLDEWFDKYKEFIEEKTTNLETGKSFYTYQKVRDGYRSLRANLEHLFVHKNNKNLSIQNTTNSLEGGTFSPMKKKINIHAGMKKSLKLKMVDYYLINHKKK